MRITKGDKDITIPNWIIFIGILAVDNIASNVLKVINNKNIAKFMEENDDEEAQ